MFVECHKDIVLIIMEIKKPEQCVQALSEEEYTQYIHHPAREKA